jgi:threonine-phosphate decarboxylase
MMDPFEHGGNVYADAPAAGWLDFSANINPLGLSGLVYDSIQSHLADIVHYPEPSGGHLKSSIAAFYDIPEDEIVLGNGAAELFYIFFHMVRTARVLLPVPSFSEYERAARAAGTEVRYYALPPAGGFKLEWKKMRAAMQQTDCFVLGNPDNPTGRLLCRGELTELVAYAVQRGIWSIIDESFLDFRRDAASYTIRDLVHGYDKLVVIQSMTKFYALPGLRLGFGIMPPALAQCMEKNKDVWNVNLLAQAAGIAALSPKNDTYRERTHQVIRQEQAWLMEQFAAISGIEAAEPSVNFILLDIGSTGQTASEFAARLRAKGILVRDCSNYPGLDGQHIRVAVRLHEENMRLIKAIRDGIA